MENRLPSVFILYCKIFLRFFTGFAFFAMILFLSFLQMTSFSILAIQEKVIYSYNYLKLHTGE